MARDVHLQIHDVLFSHQDCVTPIGQWYIASWIRFQGMDEDVSKEEVDGREG